MPFPTYLAKSWSYRAQVRVRSSILSPGHQICCGIRVRRKSIQHAGQHCIPTCRSGGMAMSLSNKDCMGQRPARTDSCQSRREAVCVIDWCCVPSGAVSSHERLRDRSTPRNASAIPLPTVKAAVKAISAAAQLQRRQQRKNDGRRPWSCRQGCCCLGAVSPSLPAAAAANMAAEASASA